MVRVKVLAGMLRIMLEDKHSYCNPGHTVVIKWLNDCVCLEVDCSADFKVGFGRLSNFPQPQCQLYVFKHHQGNVSKGNVPDWHHRPCDVHVFPILMFHLAFDSYFSKHPQIPRFPPIARAVSLACLECWVVLISWPTSLQISKVMMDDGENNMTWHDP